MPEERKRMQNVKFRNVGEMLAYLPEDQLQITERLQGIIWETIPRVKEKLSYNVPFYSVRKNMCFIWPGAIPWGKTVKDGVTLGFSYGYLLHDVSNFLEQGDRKQVYTKTYFRVEEIDEEIIRHFLLESVEIDEMLYREKLQNRSKRIGK